MAQTTLISALTPGSGKMAVMHLRATRIWEAYQRTPKKLLHTKVVFVDKQGSQIMLTVWNNQKDDYFPLLKEGHVYRISDIKVVTDLKDYKSVNRDIGLNFYHRTRVEPVADTNNIPQYAFELTKFADVKPLLWAIKNFIDVVGMVKDYKDPEPASNGANKMDVLLLDNSQQQMMVSLWEEKAIEFQQGLRNLHGEPAFVVVTGLLAKKYSAKDIILSSGDATIIYFNINYAPLTELKTSMIAAAGKAGNNILQPTRRHFVSTEDNKLTDATIQEILDTELSNSQEVKRFVCEATIVDVSKYEGWYHDACQKCQKKIKMNDAKFFCDNCNVETNSYKLRYKITVGVKDDSARATFTLINNDAERVIGVPIESIISHIGEENISEEIPPMINNVIGKKCAFEVKVTSYNMDGRGGYGVARLSLIDGAAPASAPYTADEEPGPSKKKKLA